MTASGEVPRTSFFDLLIAGDFGRAPPDSTKNFSDCPVTKRGESGSALLGLGERGTLVAGERREATNGDVSLLN